MALIKEQLPDVVELMVRSLRVGHPFSSSLGIVAREVADHLGTEMGVIADEATYGRDLSEALKDMSERLDIAGPTFSRALGNIKVWRVSWLPPAIDAWPFAQFGELAPMVLVGGAGHLLNRSDGRDAPARRDRDQSAGFRGRRALARRAPDTQPDGSACCPPGNENGGAKVGHGSGGVTLLRAA